MANRYRICEEITAKDYSDRAFSNRLDTRNTITVGLNSVEARPMVRVPPITCLQGHWHI